MRRLLPAGIYRIIRQAYFEVIFLLGPGFATWRLRQSTRDPITHMQKVRHKMAFDRDPQLTLLSDKIKVREYVADEVGAQYLPKVYFSGYALDEINWNQLPREYACKVNHGAGGVIIVREGADKSASLPSDLSAIGWTHFEIHPDNVDPIAMTTLLRHWLSLDYWWKKNTLLPEWAYRDIKRGVIIEELLTVGAELPNDYKFYIVNGNVKLIRVLTSRFTNSRGLYEYDREWNFIGFTRWDNSWKKLPGDPEEIPNLKDDSPSISAELVQVAEAIGVATDALRIDLYAVGDRVVFGEATVYPNAGYDFFTKEWLDEEIGKDWRPKYVPL